MKCNELSRIALGPNLAPCLDPQVVSKGMPKIAMSPSRRSDNSVTGALMNVAIPAYAGAVRLFMLMQKSPFKENHSLMYRKLETISKEVLAGQPEFYQIRWMNGLS
jgi:hypothetical protein